jgi:phosphatidylglycerophosphate synthase
MPQPDNTTFSIDYYIYEYIFNPIAKKICFISPNVITILGGLLIIPMSTNILNNGNIYTFTFLAFLKKALDCMDGSVARQCNTCSKLGATLDIMTDTITVAILNLLFIYKLYQQNQINNHIYIVILTILMVIFSIIQVYKELYCDRNYNNMFRFKLEKYAHDNILVLYPISYYVMKKVLSE